MGLKTDELGEMPGSLRFKEGADASHGCVQIMRKR